MERSSRGEVKRDDGERLRRAEEKSRGVEGVEGVEGEIRSLWV